jgi:hypothetical protein
MRTKFVLTTILLTLGFCYLLNAQTLFPKVGISVAKIQGEDNTGVKSRIGLSFGVGYSVDIGGIFSFQPELLFIQKGAKLDYSDSQPGFYRFELDGYLKVNYLEIPVLFKANFPTNTEAVKVYLIAGPAMSFGLGGKTKLHFYYEEDGFILEEGGKGKVKFGDEPDNYEGYNAYLKRVDISAQLGGGVILYDKFMIDLRYGIGLTDLSDNEESRHRVFQFTVGMPIQLKK